MTTRPRFARDINLLPGLAAVALFVVMAVVFVGAAFDPSQGGFPDVSITASLGYVLFNLGGTELAANTPGFLAAFEIIDVLLVAALVGAVMLARREDENAGEPLEPNPGPGSDSGRGLAERADGGPDVSSSGARQHASSDGGTDASSVTRRDGGDE